VISGNDGILVSTAHDELVGRARQHLSKWVRERRTDGAPP
jgi:hypothetical protein